MKEGILECDDKQTVDGWKYERVLVSSKQQTTYTTDDHQ